jgi:KaiC/GvpD/RAD55 family RecA-like ATPase
MRELPSRASLALLASGRFNSPFEKPTTSPASHARLELMSDRFSTGLPWLDELLGGGLLPGTLTVALGATGIGKTQLGLAFAHAGRAQDGEPGLICDLTTRGDEQSHRDYARRLFGWQLSERRADEPVDLEAIWEASRSRRDYLHLFNRSGRRVTVHDLEPDDWRKWKIELSRKLDRAIAFFYANFAHGVRRCVIDGVEPVERAAESFQFHVIDYIYHQILHKEYDWVARDLFRQRFRENAARVAAQAYDHRQIATLVLLTSHETLLDDLLTRHIETGDLLTNANTILLLGKVREGTRMTRALHVAKHRGSRCDDAIVPFEVTERGLERTR